MISSFRKIKPSIHKDVYLAPSCDVIGRVTLEKDVSIWHQAVLRADINQIHIAEGTNIQDGSILHVTEENALRIGRYVTVGHAAIIHACKIGDYSLIGMGATVLDGAKIGHHVIIGANALVPQNKEIPDYSMAFGSPVKIIRNLTDEEIKSLEEHAKDYVAYSKEFIAEEKHEDA